MKKKRPTHSTESRGSGWTAALRGALFTLVILFLIGYVTLLAASRTEGFTVLVERRLSRHGGRTWRVDSARISPTLHLHLQNARIESGEGASTFRCEELVLAPGFILKPDVPGLPNTLQARNVEAVWIEQEEADSDDYLTVWAERLRPGGPAVPALFPEPAVEAPRTRRLSPWPAYRVRIENADMEWRSREGNLRASARGVTLRATPGTVAGHRLTHVRLAAWKWNVGADRVRYDVVAEWLDREGLRWILEVSE